MSLQVKSHRFVEGLDVVVVKIGFGDTLISVCHIIFWSFAFVSFINRKRSC